MTPSASTSDEDLGEFEEFTLPEGAAEGAEQDEKPSDDSVRPFEGGREESAVKERLKVSKVEGLAKLRWEQNHTAG